MRKLFLGVIVSLLISTPIYAQTIQANVGVPETAVNAEDLTAATGNAPFDYSLAIGTNGASAFTWQTIYSAAPSTVTVLLQGSTDCSTYATIDTSTNVNGEIRSVFGSWRCVRVNNTVVTGGAGKTLTVKFVYSTGRMVGSTSGVTHYTGGIFSGLISLPAGTAAVPSLTGPTVVDGFYFPGPDQINISMSGNNRFEFTGLTFQPASTDTNIFGGPARQWTFVYVSRGISGGRSKSLTDAAAAVTFMQAAIAANSWYAGELGWTATSVSGINQLVANGRVRYWATDTAGTPVCGINKIGTDGEGHSGGVNTLVCTLTAATVTTNCAIQVTCTNDTAAAQAITFYGRNDSQLTATLTFP